MSFTWINSNVWLPQKWISLTNFVVAYDKIVVFFYKEKERRSLPIEMVGFVFFLLTVYVCVCSCRWNGLLFKRSDQNTKRKKIRQIKTRLSQFHVHVGQIIFWCRNLHSSDFFIYNFVLLFTKCNNTQLATTMMPYLTSRLNVAVLSPMLKRSLHSLKMATQPSNVRFTLVPIACHGCFGHFQVIDSRTINKKEGWTFIESNSIVSTEIC